MKNRFALVLALPLLACGGGRPPAQDAPATTAPASVTDAAPAAGPDGAACSLVSEADVTAIMGHPMKRAEEVKPMECLLVSASGDTTKSVTFQVVPGTEMFDQKGAGTEPLSGIGDKAAMMGGNIVIAVKGGRTFLGGVYDGTNLAAGKERSIALARKVVGAM